MCSISPHSPALAFLKCALLLRVDCAYEKCLTVALTNAFFVKLYLCFSEATCGNISKVVGAYSSSVISHWAPLCQKCLSLHCFDTAKMSQPKLMRVVLCLSISQFLYFPICNVCFHWLAPCSERTLSTVSLFQTLFNSPQIDRLFVFSDCVHAVYHGYE